MASEKLEISLERRSPTELSEREMQGVMDRARTERAERMAAFVDSIGGKKLAEMAANISPLGTVTTGVSAARGKTFSGEHLTLRDRLIYGLVCTASSLCYGLLTYGIARGSPTALTLSAASGAVSWSIYSVQEGGKLGAKTVRKLLPVIEKSIKVAGELNMDKAAAFLEGVQKVIKRVGEDMVEAIVAMAEDDDRDASLEAGKDTKHD